MKKRSKIIMAIVITIAIALYAVYVYNNAPGNGKFHLVCPTYVLLDLYCVGCGMTRFVYYMMHGNFKLALSYNVLGIVIVPGLIYLYYLFIRWAFFDIKMKNMPLWIAIGITIILILYSLLRNIPFEPFIYLAPPA